MSTVYLSAPNGVATGYLMRSGPYVTLREAREITRLVLFTPLARDPKFTAEFEDERTLVLDLPPHVPAGAEARLLRLMIESHIRRHGNTSTGIIMAGVRAGASL